MSGLEIGLVIVAVGGWLLAVFMWIAACGRDDALIEARNEIRRQVYRRRDVEQALAAERRRNRRADSRALRIGGRS